MAGWLRRNLVLVAGLVLPVLLVLAFLLLQDLPRFLNDPPEYDFVVVAYRHDAQHPRDYRLSFEVREGRLQARATPVGDDAWAGRQHAVLFRYRAAANRFAEIAWDLPAGLDDLDTATEFTLPETAGLRLDKTARAPDGYVFEFAGYRGRGGLLGELFGMEGRWNGQFVLDRDGAYFQLPDPGARPYFYGHDVHFLGWIVGGEDAR